MMLDTTVLHYFQTVRTPARTAFFGDITMLGNIAFVIPVCIAAAVLLLYLNKRRELLVLGSSVVFSETVTYIAKQVFHRPRPPYGLIVETDYSFPSGHATIAVALYGCIVILLFQHFKNPYVRAIIAIFFPALILLIGISRLYLGVHYFSDIMAGYAVGAGGTLLATLVLSKILMKKHMNR